MSVAENMGHIIEDDAELAARLAEVAGRIAVELRDSGLIYGKALGQAGDAVANAFLMRGGVSGWLMPPSGPRVVGVSARASTVSMPAVTLAKIT